MRLDLERFLSLTVMLGTVGTLGCTVTYGTNSPGTAPPANTQPAPSATDAPGIDRNSPSAEPPIDDSPDPTTETQGDPTTESADPTVEVPHWD
jgi:hypothetical protein